MTLGVRDVVKFVILELLDESQNYPCAVIPLPASTSNIIVYKFFRLLVTLRFPGQCILNVTLGEELATVVVTVTVASALEDVPFAVSEELADEAALEPVDDVPAEVPEELGEDVLAVA
jgi:hypothetical protein